MQLRSRGMKLMRWIGLILLCGGLILLLRWLQTEPFLATGVCPAGFKFFNDLNGNSFCCKGTVKDKQCTATGKNTFCGLAPNLLDPRTGKKLPTCSMMMDAIANSTSGKYCTEEMPNYIAPSGTYKYGGCSFLPATGDGSGFPTGPDGRSLATPYCLIYGKNNLYDYLEHNRQTGVFNCETLKLKESVQCPKGLYVAQDPAKQGGFITCKSSSLPDSKTGDPQFCLPDEVLAQLKDSNNNLIGLETAKKVCWSCSHYKKRWIDKDTTAKCIN